MTDVKDIDAFDREIPAHFERVSKLAFETALESGYPVTVATDGAIWCYIKNGDQVERKKLKDIEKRVPLEHGKVFTVKL